MGKMYENVKTWNPFAGCRYDCVYCRPSFQRLLKRMPCAKCKQYEPHFHPDRLDRIPPRNTLFVCGTGDLAFAPKDVWKNILKAVRGNSTKHPLAEYYFQSKNPACFEPWLPELPESAILVTTLETNRDEGYSRFSKAPMPSRRAADFGRLRWPRKIVTVEPLMDFDLGTGGIDDLILSIKPEAVYVGYNSRPKEVKLPEPSLEKTASLIETLVGNGIPVRPKDLRGLTPTATPPATSDKDGE